MKEENQNKVCALCDVDEKKIGKYYELYDDINRKIITKVPIIHFSKAQSPFILCVKLVSNQHYYSIEQFDNVFLLQDMTDGVFEQNLNSLNLEEGTDYIYFS